jgi:hypothetical protein
MIRDTVWQCSDGIKVYADPSEADSSICYFVGDVVSNDEDPLVLVYPPWALSLIADVAFTELVIRQIAEQQLELHLSKWVFKLSVLQ